jgi:hypothetical protein
MFEDLVSAFCGEPFGKIRACRLSGVANSTLTRLDRYDILRTHPKGTTLGGMAEWLIALVLKMRMP